MNTTPVIAAALGGLLAGPLVRTAVWRHTVTGPPRTTCPNCERGAWWNTNTPFTGHRHICPVCSSPPPLAPELLTAGGFAIAASIGGPVLQTLALCWLAAFASALALIDAAVKRLPDELTGPAFGGTTLLLTGAAIQHGRPDTALRLLLAAAALASAYLILALTASIGLGDVKLAPTLGAALGYISWTDVYLGTAAAFCLGGLYAAPRIILGRSQRGSTMPFGPFIILGAFAVLLRIGL